MLQFPDFGAQNTGTLSTTITVPGDAELVLVGVVGFSATLHFFSDGVLKFTKGGVDTAMTTVVGGNDDVNFTAGVMFWMVLPDTGANKTLKYDWGGSGTMDSNHQIMSITFWKGIDTSSPVRFSGGASAFPITGGGGNVNLTTVNGDKVVAWVGAFNNSVGGATEGTADTWQNLTLLSQITHAVDMDGAWATADPTGTSLAVRLLTATNFDDGGLSAVVLKPAGPASFPPFNPWPQVAPVWAQ